MKSTFFLIFIFALLVFFPLNMNAHEGHNQHNLPLPAWNLQTGKTIEGSFLLFKNDTVFLEKQDHSLLKIAITDFAKDSKEKILLKVKAIEALNQELAPKNAEKDRHLAQKNKFIWLMILVFILVTGIFFVKWYAKRRLVAVVLLAGVIALLSFNGGGIYSIAGTDPEEMDRAFEPFKPTIRTFWDNNYFYVESRGIPDHEMMTGIVKWQQQVPIPQCYLGNNAWPIPLNPEIAASPVPVNQEHFLRGAVAVAANGVPIFNPYTNTGIDALVDGQLDNFGGHSGRADDYHYHIAPLHLDTITADVLPIAYALDGFAIYGPLEPDGSPMKALDGNHGHFGSNGVYHYHGTKEKPYMIGNMVGKVTEDNTMQIIPQAAAKGVRPALTPLNGAAITDCTPNTTNNGYVLTYTKSGQTYKVDYSWTMAGKYTFQFIGPTGTTTSVYNGFVPCSIASATDELPSFSLPIVIAPNPAIADCFVSGLDENQWQSLQKVEIFNSMGQSVLVKKRDFREISVAGFQPGTYLIQFCFSNGKMTKKLLVQ